VSVRVLWATVLTHHHGPRRGAHFPPTSCSSVGNGGTGSAPPSTGGVDVVCGPGEPRHRRSLQTVGAASGELRPARAASPSTCFRGSGLPRWASAGAASPCEPQRVGRLPDDQRRGADLYRRAVARSPHRRVEVAQASCGRHRFFFCFS
jgi:hypothetical protein